MVYEHEDDLVHVCGRRKRNRPARRFIFGGMLVVIGAAMLTGGFGFMAMPNLWNMWPLLFVASGLYKIVEADYPAHYIKGVATIGLGAWLYACVNHVAGWTFQTTWPVVLIIIGGSMLLRGLPGMYGRKGE
ncbi:hypothetical protein KSF73_10475 [Burkholderiaceae bacterium DAT-1]|nr:hypothetical protein [Burkholderiaceae bacterium DAT-1]